MTLSALLNQLGQQLLHKVENPRLEADLLVAHVLKLSRAELYMRSNDTLSEEQINTILLLVARRTKQEPMAYILGHKEFWSLNLKVTPATLIPRPETEALVEWILDKFSNSANLKVADLGTGSGAIALALASERPLWKITATDASSSTLKIAQENAASLNIDSIEFRLGNWCEAFLDTHYDLIISNPPYIAENDPHLAALTYEPSSALIAKNSGLSDLTELIREAKNYLNEQGVLVLEHGFEQGPAVRKLFSEYGYDKIATQCDLGRQERFTTAVRNN